MPLVLESEMMGLVYADSRRPGSLVTTLDLELLRAFAERAALWIAARRSASTLASLAGPIPWAGIAAAHAGERHAGP